MIRINVITEGQSELRFVKNTLKSVFCRESGSGCQMCADKYQQTVKL